MHLIKAMQQLFKSVRTLLKLTAAISNAIIKRSLAFAIKPWNSISELCQQSAIAFNKLTDDLSKWGEKKIYLVTDNKEFGCEDCSQTWSVKRGQIFEKL